MFNLDPLLYSRVGGFFRGAAGFVELAAVIEASGEVVGDEEGEWGGLLECL